MDNGALTRDQRERYEIALAGWRADLLDYAAGQFDSIGMTAQADQARARAQYHRDVASNLEAFRADRDTNGPHGKWKVPHQLARFDLKFRRDVHQVFNHAETSTNFVEPSPAELGVI